VVRFDGWLEGPGTAHAWVNGSRSAAAQVRAGDGSRYDARSHQLVVLDAQGREVRLRAGQSMDQEAALNLEGR